MTECSKNNLPALVVGGGIGGLTTAIALARRGWAVRVIEQAPEFREIGAGIQLGPNVFKMLEKLQLTEEVKALASFPANLVMMDGISGEEVTKIPLEGLFRRRFKQPYGLVHRADLHDLLLAKATKERLITLDTGSKVIRYADDGRTVEVVLQDGGTISGCALVGADGLWSTVRSQLANDGPPRISGHIAYRAVLPIEHVPAHLLKNNMTLWAGAKTHLVHYPLRGGKLYNLVAVFHSDRYEEGWDTFGDVEELHQRFKDAVPEVKAMLEKIDTWKMWVLCDRDPIKEWSKGRVTLLGDAAHPMLQYMAQGACMAVEDALVLAEEVDLREGQFESAFEAYARRRYMRTGRVQMSARLYGEFFHAAGTSRELRNAFLSGRTEEQSVESMAWLYDGIDVRDLPTAQRQAPASLGVA